MRRLVSYRFNRTGRVSRRRRPYYRRTEYRFMTDDGWPALAKLIKKPSGLVADLTGTAAELVVTGG